MAGDGELTLSGDITDYPSESGDLTTAGAVTVILSGTTSYAGNTTISEGTLALSPSGNVTFADAIDGSGTLKKLGAGTLLSPEPTRPTAAAR